ncbi:hypothetical protein [Leadbetterella sp. DM7]|uniref:hypothetical protein n=1 Tax=Leadbetterella sp. DM7 TaxID=3235085 RepID=UPI00349EDCD8
MTGLLLSMLGGLAYYSRSKYFPSAYAKLKGRIPAGAGGILLLLATGLCMRQYGIGMGIFMASVIIPAAFCLLIFVLNLPRKYTWVSLGVLLIFLWIDYAG